MSECKVQPMYVPDSLAPPKGCWPTTEPVVLSLM